MAERQNSKHVLFVKSVPHEWLFPYMSAVVHHGGAGTTAAALRSGVPQVIIPFGNDQFTWGRRMNELGVGAKTIPRKKLTGEKLSEAIRFTQTVSVLENAKQMGAKVKAERGAQKAAELIIETLKNYQSDKKEMMNHTKS